jgi:integrase
MQQQLMKTDGKFVRVGDLLYVRNGRLYGMKRIDGKLVRKVAPLQGLDAVDTRGRPTMAAKRWVRQWADQLESADYFAEKESKKEPTWGELLEAYEIHARVEFEVSHSPRPETVEANLSVTRSLLRDAGVTMNDTISRLTVDRIDMVIQEMVARGVRSTSVHSILARLSSLFTGWVTDYYKRRNGWEVKAPEVPRMRSKSFLVDRYQRPPEALREKTLTWYKSLEDTQPKVWLAATLMLQFGMRNIDACLLTWDHFKQEGDLMVLGYTPRKTSTSSGRVVHVPFDKELYVRMRRAAGHKTQLVLGGEGKELYSSINAQMRCLGWDLEKYTKASYELRKLCIDRIYREFGAEAATQVSGDDIKTVCRYYADPSRAFSVAFNL